MTEQELLEQTMELFKEFRQELADTEFAPPPFDDRPVDVNIFERFAQRATALIKQAGYVQITLDKDGVNYLENALDAHAADGICEPCENSCRNFIAKLRERLERDA